MTDIKDMTDAELVEAVAMEVLEREVSSVSALYPKVYYNNDVMYEAIEKAMERKEG